MVLRRVNMTVRPGEHNDDSFQENMNFNEVLFRVFFQTQPII